MSLRISRLVAAAACLWLGVIPGQAREASGVIARFSGTWIGTGQLLFGQQSGLQFHCELEGEPTKTQLTFRMKGRCWMGGISAPVYGSVRYSAMTDRFHGEFMGGAQGSGVDVEGSEASDGIALTLTRPPARGRLTAQSVNADQMRIMMYFEDPQSNREIPVVAMGFTRKEASAMGLPDFLPDVATGSLPAEPE